MTDTPGSKTVTVNLGDRRYDIRIGSGLLASAGEEIALLLQRPFTIVITDETVAALHLNTLQASLEKAGISHDAIVLPPGESSKNFAVLEQLTDSLLAKQIERSDVVITLGGGVIGDLAGFAASMVRRGIDFVQIPTTLLAQVDSSVGGKTGINTRHGKNLIGAFHQPQLVIADIDLLATLPRREFLAGYAEVVKYGLLGDREFFDWLDVNAAALIGGDVTARTNAVAVSCRTKARIVAEDERETGVRALLNLGHTFGHALEAEARFDGRILHGEAVGIGVIMAFELSARLGFCPPADAARVRAHFAACGLPTTAAGVGLSSATTEALIEHMKQDKKVSRGKLTFVLARAIGEAFLTQDVDIADLRDLLVRELAA